MATIHARPQQRSIGRLFAAATLTVLLVLILVRGQVFADRLHGLLGAEDDSLAQSEAWVAANLPVDARVVADAVVMADLAKTGTPAWNLLDYRTLDAQKASAASASGWKVYEYIISTPALRTSLAPAGQTRTAIASSTIVASFGAGNTRVEVREIDPDGVDAAAASRAQAEQASSEAGRQLLTNANIRLSPEAAQDVVSGKADGRLLSVLVGLGSQHTLTIGSFTDPAPSGLFPSELRQVSVLVVDGSLVADQTPQVAAVVDWLAAQTGAFRPSAVAVRGNQLLIRFRILGSTGQQCASCSGAPGLPKCQPCP